jgi:hypothetical protein
MLRIARRNPTSSRRGEVSFDPAVIELDLITL